MGGGKKTTTTNQQQSSTTTTPGTQYGEAALPGFESAFQDALDMGAWQGGTIANAGQNNWTGPVAYEGNYFAPDPNYAGPTKAAATTGERQGAQGMVDYGQSLIPQTNNIVQSGMDFAGTVADGSRFDINNPIFQNYVESLKQDSKEQFDRSITGLAPNAVATGAYDNTNFNRQNVWLQDTFQENENNMLAKLYWDQQGRGLEAVQNLPQFLAGLQAAGTQPYNMMQEGGAALRGFDQIDIDNLIAQYEAGKQNEQAGINNTLANFDAGLRNDMSGFFGEQQNAQDWLDNERGQFELDRNDALNMYAQYFQALGLVPGQSSTGEMSGTTTTKEQAGFLQTLSSLVGTAAGAMNLFKGGGIPSVNVGGTGGNSSGGGMQLPQGGSNPYPSGTAAVYDLFNPYKPGVAR